MPAEAAASKAWVGSEPRPVRQGLRDKDWSLNRATCLREKCSRRMEALVLLFITSMIVGVSGAATPGPLLIVNITETARRGFWAGPAVALGHSLLELVTVALLSLGLSVCEKHKREYYS